MKIRDILETNSTLETKSDVFKTSENNPLFYLKKAIQYFGRKKLYGGNCGVFALALANFLKEKNIRVQIAVICYDSNFGDEDDISPEDIIKADIPVYHVAIVFDKMFYDGDGRVPGSKIQKWVKAQYGDSSPALFVFDLDTPGLSSLINTETAWYIPYDTFFSFFKSAQLNEAQTFEIDEKRVWKNPTQSTFKNLLRKYREMRGFSTQNFFYVWDAKEMLHWEVEGYVEYENKNENPVRLVIALADVGLSGFDEWDNSNEHRSLDDTIEYLAGGYVNGVWADDVPTNHLAFYRAINGLTNK